MGSKYPHEGRERKKSVGPGAIVVIEPQVDSFFATGPHAVEESVPLSEPLACVETLGRSVVDRMIQRFAQADVELISVLVQEGSFQGRPFRGSFQNVEYKTVNDVNAEILSTLRDHSQRGFEHSFSLSV